MQSSPNGLQLLQEMFGSAPRQSDQAAKGQDQKRCPGGAYRERMPRLFWCFLQVTFFDYA